MSDQMATERDCYIPRPYPLLEFIKRTREDQLSTLESDYFDRDIMITSLLGRKYVFPNRPDYIAHVLLGNQANYAKGELVRNILYPFIGNGLFSSEGEFWRRQRRIAAPMFHHRRLVGFAKVMTDCTKEVLDRWRNRGDQVFDVLPEMNALALDVITRTMFSSDGVREAMDVQRQITEILAQANPGWADYLGLPNWLPGRYPRALLRAVAELDRIVRGLVAPRRADPGSRDDLLSMLLGAKDPETGEGMTDRQLRDEIMTMFLAGHETTANLMAWAWFVIGSHPEVEAKLHDEIDAVLGDRTPDFEDVAKLRYTRMILDETLRLYPPVIGLARVALGPDRVGPIDIRKGTFVTVHTYILHRNPKLWPDPDRFDPQRFAPDVAAARDRFAYLPFGGGPRICIGNSFALTEATIALAMMARRFRLRLDPDHRVAPIGLITLRPRDGVRVRLEPRN